MIFIKRRELFTIIAFFLMASNVLSVNDKWKGLSIRSLSGFYARFYNMENDPKFEKEIGFISGWALEYSFDMSGKKYLSLDMSFPYYNEIFEGEEIASSPIFGRFIFPRFFLMLIPIFKAHIGYELREDILLTIGPVYFWGVGARVRKLIASNISFDFEIHYFLDRIFINDGIHDLHAMFSFSYIFNQ